MADKTTFIKLDRNILRWRWYKDANVFRVFIYLLITAAYRETEINGITLRRGQCLTTYKELATVNSLSLKAVRTAISKLIDTGEISTERLSKGVIITITNFELYQGHYNLAFFVDMRNGGNHFDEKGHSFFEKRAFTKIPEKPLNSLRNLELQQVVGAFTFEKKGIHFDEKGQSKEESNQRRNLRNNYFYYNKKNNILLLQAHAHMRDNINYILTIYHSICVDYPRVKALSEPIIEELLKSLERYSLEQFKEVFIKAETSHYLRGKNPQRRRANFDWLINADNIAKILNGNYDDLPNENSSFDNDEFLKTALKRSYDNFGGKNDE